MAIFKFKNQRDRSSSYAQSSTYSSASSTSSLSSTSSDDSRIKKAWKKVKGSLKRDHKGDNPAASFVELVAPIETTTATDAIIAAPILSTQTAVPHNRIVKSEQHKNNSDPELDDSSDDGETPEDKLDDLRRDTNAMRSEMIKLKKQSAADINQVKADNYDLQNELKQTNKNRSMLQYNNTSMVSEIRLLDAKKKQQQRDHEAELAMATKDQEAALSDLEELNTYSVKLQESIAARQSWNEALKLKIKTQENLSAEALSQIADKIKQRGERLDELLHQLAAKRTECEEISRDYEKATADLATTNQAIVDAAAAEKDLTNNIQVLRSKLAAMAAEINRLGNITAQQQTTSDKLAAAYRLMANRTSRIQTLENAIKIGKNKIQQTMTTDEERDFPDLKKKKKSSIRHLVR
jgi:chromosome segregation ATPase